MSLGVLNCVEESVYKKQRREGGPRGRFAWRQSQMLTERHKRCLERAWSQREVKVNKKFMRHRRYLTVRKAELEERWKESKARSAGFATPCSTTWACFCMFARTQR